MGAAAAALALTVAGGAQAAVFAFNSNPGGLQGNGSADDTYTLTVSGLTVTVKGFGSLGSNVSLSDQDDVTWSSLGLGVEGNGDDGINTDDDEGEGLLLDFGQIVNLTQAQFSAWSSQSGDDADYRFSNGLPSGSLTDISGLSVNSSVATWNTSLTGRYFFFAAIDDESRDADKFWLKSVTASAATPPGPGSAVPEPATWAMMIIGFGLAGTQIRRQVRDQKRSFAV